MSEFKERAIKDGNWENRANFLHNYAEFDNYCSNNYGKGNFIDWASKTIPLFEKVKPLLVELIQLDTIKSHSFQFQISPNVQDATTLLRIELLGIDETSTYSKGTNQAVFDLLALIRHNLIHQNKSETEDVQYNRNHEIVRIANAISVILLEQIENKDE